jgi:hypothetical protein
MNKTIQFMLEGSEFPTAKLRGINSNHNHTTFIRIFGYISVRAEMDVSFDCMTGFENIVYFFLGGGIRPLRRQTKEGQHSWLKTDNKKKQSAVGTKTNQPVGKPNN